jgi:hypothetical protein
VQFSPPREFYVEVIEIRLDLNRNPRNPAKPVHPEYPVLLIIRTHILSVRPEVFSLTVADIPTNGAVLGI